MDTLLRTTSYVVKKMIKAFFNAVLRAPLKDAKISNIILKSIFDENDLNLKTWLSK